MDKMEWIQNVCRNGVHAPTAGYIFENIKEIQMLKDRVSQLEKQVEELEFDGIKSDEPEIVPDSKGPEKKTKTKKTKLKSQEKSEEKF